MRLNYDYVRDLLIYVDKKSSYDPDTRFHRKIKFPDCLLEGRFAKHNQDELYYASELLIKEGIIRCSKNPTWYHGNLLFADIIGLSSRGYEILNPIRDDAVWNELTKRAEKIGGTSIDAMVRAAPEVARQLANG